MSAVFEAPVDPDSERELIGTVVSSGTSPSFFDVEFRLDVDASVSPGRFVAIAAVRADGRPSLILARVDDVHEINPHEDAQSSTIRKVLPFGTDYAPEGESTVIFRLASVEPLEEALVDDAGNVVSVGAVETLPRAGAPVFEAGPELVLPALGLEDEPAKGLHVGTVRGSDVPVVLNRGVIQRHIFIAGGIGSGKSYTRGVLAEELHAWGVPQVNIDVNGEMIAATDELGGVNLVPGRDGFTLPLSALSSSDVIEAIPSINAGTNMETLVRFSHETLLRDVGRGNIPHFGVAELLDQMDRSAFTLEMTTGSGADRRPNRQTVEPAKLRTQSLTRLPFLGAPFDWAAKLVPGAIINIDCRDLLLSDLRLIAASIARDLQSLARGRRIPFVALSIDEFHLVAPAQDEAVATQVLREIARVGRHQRLGLILTTQSPSDVDRSILKRLLTRFLHSIEPDQLDALRGVFSDASDDLVRSMPKLPQGVAVVTGAFETIRHATVVDIRTRRTTHGGGTPDIWADFADRGWTGKRDA